MEEIFNTWNDEILPPKLHFSTPKEFENDRKHADYIDADGFASFIQLVKSKVDRDIDIMIEAKKKDKALLKLIEDLRKTNLDFKFIDETTIEV